MAGKEEEDREKAPPLEKESRKGTEDFRQVVGKEKENRKKAAPLEKESKKGVQLPLLDKGIWKFTGVTKIYDMKDFDKVSEMMEHHTDGFIKAAIRC
ncbi:MAG: hypothetical protein ACLRO4_08780 [Lachnospiraceae bacterium]